MPTIDLGGGSMQLTFYPKEKMTIDSAPSDYIVSKVRKSTFSSKINQTNVDRIWRLVPAVHTLVLGRWVDVGP